MGGLDYLEFYRPSEIKAGDELFSPFVAAGWKSATERNMRPAQWLGFLKIMTCLGAEYVETGFFSPLQFSAKEKNVQLPQNYVWQAAAPAYAQVRFLTEIRDDFRGFVDKIHLAISDGILGRRR